MAKRHKALVGLHYPTNPKDPREEWEMRHVAPGEVVDDIPAQSIPWLLEGGRIEEAATDRSKLPEDFPGYAALVEAGIKTYADVERHYDELLEVKGIGEKTRDEIRLALVRDEEGGDAA